MYASNSAFAETLPDQLPTFSPQARRLPAP
jgi:hypothetical protein